MQKISSEGIFAPKHGLLEPISPAFPAAWRDARGWSLLTETRLQDPTLQPPSQPSPGCFNLPETLLARQESPCAVYSHQKLIKP